MAPDFEQQLAARTSQLCFVRLRRQAPSLGDEEPESNTRAEYQEWPIRGFLKRTTVRKETHYSMDFSL